MRSVFSASCVGVLLIGLSLGLGLGCATPTLDLTRYAYFDQPGQRDAWSAKIGAWQHRERADQGDAFVLAEVPSVDGPPAKSDASDSASDELPTLQRPAFRDAGETVDLSKLPQDRSEAMEPSDLRSKYFGFRADSRRTLARDLAEWVQSQAKQHYVADGPIDHWATLEETLREDGDDCDGLELLSFHALRDLGFDPREVYRSIVYRPSDGQHHMVTLWFEDPADPWVLDPTGAMTTKMVRMSSLPAWVPIKLFSETAEYTVEPDDDVLRTTRLAARP
jgi:hypothetical protein